MTHRRTVAWGWGYEDQQLTVVQQKAIAKGVAANLKVSDI